ncbi:1-acyl-sn-glycerol-3-phosphate acyltransferase [Bacteroidales bacterium]|nr:1-acyl-sn-glycerol-3-phosphate acyltransferase [Bacteroidales bacterium]
MSIQSIQSKACKYLYYLYQWLILFPLALLSTVLCTSSIIIGCFVASSRFWGYYPGIIWGRFICRTALLNIKIVRKAKLDTKQSYVFVANHQSSLDIFLISGYLGHNFRWLMKKDLEKMPFVGTAATLGEHVFVDQSSRKGIVETMRNAKEKLRDGVSTVIFPEGHRTRDGKMAEFKRGAFQTAMSLKLPIVPISIDGAYKVLPINSYKMHRSPIKLTFHDAIPTKDLSAADLPEFMENVRQIIASELPEEGC